jgi:AmmeMemoRadiSam system protein B
MRNEERAMVPKLRQDLDVCPVPQSAGGGVLISDPFAPSESPVQLSAGAAALLPLLDGKRSITDLQLAATRLQGGLLVTQASISGFIHNLSERLLLDDEPFRRKRQALLDQWNALTERPPAHAGRGYPQDPTELGVFVDDLLVCPTTPPTPAPWAIIAPHADMRSAGGTYAAAYSLLPDEPPARVVLLGTGHRLEGNLFSLTMKDYLTPLGRSPCDRASIASLRAAGGDAVADDDWAHRGEHSLEYQCLVLQRRWGDRHPPCVPILCGSLHHLMKESAAPHAKPEVRVFLDSLAGIARAPDALVIAGVDLSHVGPRFGHAHDAHSMLRAAREHDERLLDHLFNRDPDAMWRETLSVQDRFNVCGLSALLWLTCIAPRVDGELLCYHVWRQPPYASAVTMAAAALYKR